MILTKSRVKDIDEGTLEGLKNWFFSYVQQFKSGDFDLRRNIALKEKHTLKVCKEILDIGEKLGLNDNDLRIAEVIALLHDIGRFEQYFHYHTFVDSDSENHAELGVKVLKRDGILKRVDGSIQKIILRTILYHNRATLPKRETETCLFFSKLLRDADKLDIWRVVTDYYQQKNVKRNVALELNLPDTVGISSSVYNDLMAGKIVNVTHLKNLNDFKLLQIGWIYDVNFVPTFQSISKRSYLEKIYNALPYSEKIERAFLVVQSYLNKQLQMESV